MGIILIDQRLLHQEFLRLETFRQRLPSQVERLFQRYRHVQSHEPCREQLGELELNAVVAVGHVELIAATGRPVALALVERVEIGAADGLGWSHDRPASGFSPPARI